MGKISKTASPKHEATLSPFIHNFVTVTAALPLHQLPSHLATFPKPWPLMRGDLYHWIPALNRFDDILASFTKAYKLDVGPQSVEIARECMLAGVQPDEGMTQEVLDSHDIPGDGDRILVESVLRFSTLLYENCANRGLYASSPHLSELLNTTSLSTLDLVLRLCMRLAQRYCTDRVRLSSGPFLGNIHPTTLAQHYMIDLDRIEKIAQPFVKNVNPASKQTAKVNRSEKASIITPVYAPDLLTLLKDTDDAEEGESEYGQPWVNFLSETPSEETEPSSPSPAQRRTIQSRPLGRIGTGDADISSTTEAGRTGTTPSSSWALLEVPMVELSQRSLPDLVKEYVPQVPEKARYQLLCRLRVAAALCESVEARQTIVSARVAAIANLAFIYPENQLQQKVLQQEAEETRRAHMPRQLCDLLHPPGNTSFSVPKSMQSLSMRALESLTNHRTQSNEVSGAMGVSVNHGILTYLVRKAVDYMRSDEDVTEDLQDTEWIESLFSLLHSLPKSAPRTGEGFVTAGLLDAFVGSLAFRTKRADNHRHRILNFLDVFVYNTRDAFNVMVNAGGLDVISELLGREVGTALQTVREGRGLPDEWKKPLTYSKITFQQQQTLRTLFKVIKNMMSINGGPFDRLLRNLIESSQLLAGLRTVIGHPSIYGSNVWCAAVEIFSQFIHNEPTSYGAIAEAGLTQAFLDTILGTATSDTPSDEDEVFGILATTEATCVVPTAFSAICLNEAGMKQIVESKAIDTFFDALSEPAHVKALASSTGEADNIGAAFDELVRHHPTLRPEIIRNVVKLCERLHDHVLQRSERPKLFVLNEQGGSSPEPGSNLSNDSDVEMSEVQEPKLDQPSNTSSGQSSTDFPPSEVVDPMLVVCGILQGFFRNHSLCSAFVEAGGIKALVDIAATPARADMLHHRGQGPIGKVMRIFIHHRPHLTIPLLLHKLQEALGALAPFIDQEPDQTCFAAYITPQAAEQKTEALNHLSGSNGSAILQHLLTVRNLVAMLTKSFSDIPHRASTHPIAAVNMADVYIELLRALGKLQSRLIWEFALMHKAPAHFMGSKVPGNIMDMHTGTNFSDTFAGLRDANVDDRQVSGEIGSQQKASEESQSSLDILPSHTAEDICKQNFKTMGVIIPAMPGDIASFFQAIGKSILIRRIPSSDVFQKRCTYAIASSIAEALCGVLDFPIPSGHDVRMTNYYLRSSIVYAKLAMMDKGREAGQHPLILITWQFRKAGGFEKLIKLGKLLVDSTQKLDAQDAVPAQAFGPIEGLNHLIDFLTLLTDSKNVNDATQTAALSPRGDRERDKPDYFSAAQLLVEFRTYAMRFVLPIWRSDAITSLPQDIVSGACVVLENVFQASAEVGAFGREDKVAAAEVPTISRAWRSRNPNAISGLVEQGFAQDLAEEAIYRCGESGTQAQEYCDQRSKDEDLPRFPIPPDERVSPQASRDVDQANTNPGEATSSTTLTSTDSPGSDSAAQRTREMVNQILQSDDPAAAVPEALVNNLPLSNSAEGTPDRTSEPSASFQNKPTKHRAAETDVMTAEDLNDLRSEARESLVDRCLFVLSKFDKLSFSLADLIISSVLKSPDPVAMRTDVTQTLVQSLISYQGGGSVHEESSKIASCAHLLGVVLQDKDFFDSAKDELKDNFASIGEYLAVATEQRQGESSSWVSNILLIMERILAEDAQPKQISWTPQQAADPEESDQIAELRPSIIPSEEKENLLTQLLNVLPHIGKDAGLGIAVLRVLVCLTRNRKIAQQLSIKRNLQKLFLMAKQLSTGTDKKFQGAFMLVLRNIIEDEDTVKRVMRSTIRALFEKRPRSMDTTAYVRALYHCVLRDPESFVQVTNELLMLPSYDRNQGAQLLELKKEETPADGVPDPATKDQPGKSESGGLAEGESIGVKPSAEAHDASEEVKGTELKHPILERNDGVTNFLLSELLAYKDVQDSKPSKVAEQKIAQEKTSASEDVDMAGNENDASADAASHSKNEQQKQDFKAEDHPIFVYRCFILQILGELLSSYNCSKINFLSFSRKAEPQANTPSKPRSGVLNYLLNALVPTGSLQHPADDTSKMKAATSHWAASTIIALVCRTQEIKPFGRAGRDGVDGGDEPDLFFVRRFVLEHALKAYKENNLSESPEANYSRLLSLASMFNRMLNGKPSNGQARYGRPHDNDDNIVPSAKNIAKIMFEKNYATVLTSSLSDIDTNIPGAERVIRHILQPLKLLTHTAIELSMSGDISTSPSQSMDDDGISSATSVSEVGEGREETPDLFRNSTLGMFEPGREEASSSGSSNEDEEDEMYGEEYADDMEFDEDPGNDGDDVVSDEDEAMEGVGPMEGLDGDVPMEVEIDIGDEDPDHEHSSDDDDDGEDSEDSEDEDDQEIEDEDDALEAMSDINGDDENASMPGGEDPDEWQDEDAEVGEEYGEDGGDPDDEFDIAAGRPIDIVEEGSDGDIDPYLGAMAPALGNPPIDMDTFNEDLELGRDPEDLGEHDSEDEEDDEAGDEDEEMDEEELVFGGLDPNDEALEGTYRELQESFNELIHASADVATEMPPFRWGWPTPGRRHHTHRHAVSPWGAPSIRGGDTRDRLLSMPTFRSHRHPPPHTTDDGSNPLLNRDRIGRTEHMGSPFGPFGRAPLQQTGAGRTHTHQDIFARLERDLLGGPGGVPLFSDLPPHIEQALRSIVHPGHGALMVRPVAGGHAHEYQYVLDSNTSRHATTGQNRNEPSSVISFETAHTEQRWQEAARLLFGPGCAEKSQKVVNAILKLLVPPAMERDRLRKIKAEEEAKKLEEQKVKAKAEREEREAEEKKKREEEEAKMAAERAEAEAEEAQRAEQARAHEAENAQEAPEVSANAMEGVEETSAPAAADLPDIPAEPTESRPRVMTNIRGRELDITDLGIDTAYLDALPEEMREEVILQQVAEHRSNAAAAGGEPTAIDTEFLEALPPNIREELLQQEAQDRRRREREETRRQSQAQGGPAQPEDIDPASFIASLDPMLRQQVLAESDEDMLAALPADLAAEARALGGRHRRGAVPPAYMFSNAMHGRPTGTHSHGGDDQMPKTADGKPQRRPIVQMLDKAGIATLLRLMFAPIVGSARSSLHGILMNACGNRQTRGEVVNGLLSILQDGCADVVAVERCFAQLTLRAKPTTAPKTPQSARKSTTPPPVNADVSPRLVIGQCLAALLYLAEGIPTIPQFFLMEQEVAALKPKMTRKGKGKDTKASRYPFTSLLALLERSAVTDDASTMDQLSGLLSLISRPLGELVKKAQATEERKDDDRALSAPPVEEVASPDAPTTDPAAQSSVGENAEASASQPPHEPNPTSEEASSLGAAPVEAATATSGEQTSEPVSAAAPAESNAEQVPKETEPKKHRPLTSPDVPPGILKPLVNILMARECGGQTFRHTITTMTNFSVISGAKDIFREELLQHAKELGTAITTSLQGLIDSLKTVETEMQAQTLALVDFSPTGSDQSKFSRVITALNYLFEPKPGPQNSSSVRVESSNDSDLLTLFEDQVFMEIWAHLGIALQAMKRSDKEYFSNVATILLPLIEALLVVCKRIPFNESKSTKRPVDQPQDGGKMREVFFSFTTEHKKVLNDLVRQNPKLMNATFSVLVKNSTVLEFDNKRNFFNRRLHHRTGDVRPHPTLQLNVRRDQVFLDSYKNLHFKSPQEIKYGKFNIRFHNEEGVDAGGVTREWFQVLARQMFNADYALFNPVASDRTTFHPNTLSWINQEHLQFFKFIGRIIGKALYENRVLDCHFSRAVYKKLLGQPVSMKDMETVDLEYSKNMDWMLNNDITDIITETFSLAQDKFGVVEVVDLIPNGRNIQVTEENKAEYVRKVIEYRLTGSVQEQLDSFLMGFYDIVAPDLVSIFDEGELELLISGMPDVDVDDWKANTDYQTYNASSFQIQWFWRAVRSFDKEERAKLLQFVTGTGKVPLNGFKELEGMNGFTRFSIHKDFGSTDRLPSSHTCFNQLDLPEYDNYESLRKNLYTAMTTGNEYFGYA